MESAVDVGGDVAAAATALAGLLLVFMGAILASFDGYEKREQKAVVVRYRRRAGFALVGFLLALISAATALVGKWLEIPCLILSSLALLFVSFFWAGIAAVKSVSEIE